MTYNFDKNNSVNISVEADGFLTVTRIKTVRKKSTSTVILKCLNKSPKYVDYKLKNGFCGGVVISTFDLYNKRIYYCFNIDEMFIYRAPISIPGFVKCLKKDARKFIKQLEAV